MNESLGARARPPLRRASSRSADMPAPWLAGVCSGLSVHLGVPVLTVRLVMAVASLLYGAGALLYVWLVAFVPLDTGQRQASGRRRLAEEPRSVGPDQARQVGVRRILVVGVAMLVAAVALLVVSWRADVGRLAVLGAGCIAAGLLLVWSQAGAMAHWKSARVLSVVGGGAALVTVGIVLVFAGGDPAPVLARGILVGIVVIAGAALALAPLWLRLLGELASSREQEARETERADIAAHLHDSVLQTLSLIRAGADDPTRVRSLALTQERELRSWLYTGREDPGTSTAEDLREQVGEVESRFGEEVEVVTVGDVAPGPAELAAVAATREAVTNAVRHAAPPVSVYAEVGEGELEVFVRDRGAGFDLATIPPDRHGVRDSIVGRVRRVGGDARFRRLAQGTEVHIRVPLTRAQGQQQGEEPARGPAPARAARGEEKQA